jgi:hypothetical protein
VVANGETSGGNSPTFGEETESEFHKIIISITLSKYLLGNSNDAYLSRGKMDKSMFEFPH